MTKYLDCSHIQGEPDKEQLLEITTDDLSDLEDEFSKYIMLAMGVLKEKN